MKEFTISGDIPCSTIEQIRISIIEALKIDKIKLSDRDIYLENDTFDLYIFINDTIGEYPSGDYYFSLSSTYNGSLEEVTSFLKNIGIIFNKNNIEYNFEFYESNATHDTTYIIKHSNWNAGQFGIVIDI